MTRRPEQDLHRACAEFLDFALLDDALWMHYPAGGFRTPIEAKIFRSLGVRAGVPDLLIVHKGRLIGVELKTGSRKLTPVQEEMHRRLVLAGAVVTTVRSLEELVSFLGQIVPLRASLSGPFRSGHTRPGRSTDRE